MPKAETSPLGCERTTFDALAKKQPERFSCEFNEEKPEEISLKETIGVCYVLKGLEKILQTDIEISQKLLL